MTSQSPRKKPGPKPKPRKPQDEIEQLSLRIPKSMKTGLELMSRDVRMSVNETIIYCLKRSLMDHDIDDTNALSIAESIESMESGCFQVKVADAHDGLTRSPEELRDMISKYFRETGIFRAQQTPKHLRSAAETYLLQVSEVDGPGYWTEGASLRDLVSDGFLRGRPPEDVAREWRAASKAKLAAAKKAAPKARKAK